MKKILPLGLAVILTLGTSAAPTVSDLKVTPIEPIGVAIDYTVSGVETEDEGQDYSLEVLMSGTGTVWFAQTLIGLTNCVNGAHRVYWNMAKDGLAIDPAVASIRVTHYYKCPCYCVIDLSAGSNAETHPVTYMDAMPSGGFNTTEYKTTKLVLKRVDVGAFIMGENQTDGTHWVAITRPFYMGIYEVTQKQWKLVMGTNPSSLKYDAHPVENVSYDDIRGSSGGAKWPADNAVDSTSFLGKLRDRTRLDFDLPTEAQWEYACRAGTTMSYGWGNSPDSWYMWYRDNTEAAGDNGAEVHFSNEVGTRLSNNWKFYDMHGNAEEWCLDWFGPLAYGVDPKGSPSGSKRVRRGGSSWSRPFACTSFYRSSAESSSTGWSEGFRLSLTVQDSL